MSNNKLKTFLNKYKFNNINFYISDIDPKEYIIDNKNLNIVPLELKDIYNSINESLKKNGNLSDINKRNFYKIPYILFYKINDSDMRFYYTKYFKRFLEKISKKPSLLKSTLNEILFHREQIDNDDQKNIERIKHSLKKMREKSTCSKILSSNEKFLYLEKNGLDKLAKAVLNFGIDILKNSYCPLKGRNLSGALGRRFIKAMGLYSRTQGNVEKLIDYIEFVKNEQNIDISISSETVGNLFNPFISNPNKNYSEVFRKKVERTAENIIGDPRINPAPWHCINEARDSHGTVENTANIKKFLFFARLYLYHKSRYSENVA